MRRIVSVGVLASLLAVTGCDQKAGEGAPGPLVGKLAAAADRGCACKDAACATAVRAEVEALAAGAGSIADRDLPQLQAAQARLDACLAALEPRVVSYRALTDEVCACKDAACAKQVSARFSAWAADLKRSGTKLARSDGQAILDAGKRATACLAAHGLPVPE